VEEAETESTKAMTAETENVVLVRTVLYLCCCYIKTNTDTTWG